MKTDRYNVEDLLAEVEHAGRDERRQQELGAMIDRMAGKSGKRGFWWWGARVAAAACILFFIGTAVRVWFIPTEKGEQMVAEAEVPEVVLPEVVLPTEPATAVDAKPMVHLGRVKEAAIQPVAEEQVEPAAVEEYLVEEIVEEELPVEEPVEAPVNNQIEMIAQPVVSIAQTVEPTPEKTTHAKPRERKRGFFRSLIRPAEPSLMEGTTLALLEF